MNVTTSKRAPASAERFNNWYYLIVYQHLRSNVKKSSVMTCTLMKTTSKRSPITRVRLLPGWPMREKVDIDTSICIEMAWRMENLLDSIEMEQISFSTKDPQFNQTSKK